MQLAESRCLTRDRTRASCSRSTDTSLLDHGGSPKPALLREFSSLAPSHLILPLGQKKQDPLIFSSLLSLCLLASLCSSVVSLVNCLAHSFSLCVSFSNVFVFPPASPHLSLCMNSLSSLRPAPLRVDQPALRTCLALFGSPRFSLPAGWLSSLSPSLGFPPEARNITSILS